MYPIKDQDELKSKFSQESAREIVELIDSLIKIRILEHGHSLAEIEKDQSEIIKRKITNYLLVTDPRKGVFVNR